VTGNGGAPIRIKEVRPVYPPIARDADIEGVVIVQARITEQGHVVDARANPPDSILSHAATGAVTQWEFAPAQGDGDGRNTLTVKVSFSRER
jgi:protein TonB